MFAIRPSMKRTATAGVAAISATLLVTLNPGIATGSEVTSTEASQQFATSQSRVELAGVISGEGQNDSASYTLPLEAGDRLVASGKGDTIVDESGETKFAVSVARATDASGEKVQTEFQIHDGTLAQTISEEEAGEVDYPVSVETHALPYFIVKCLVGLGLSTQDIARIASMGTWASIAGAFGRAAAACVFGK